MIKIWFEPHSTTDDNEAKVASGWNDVDLSEKGLQQSQDLVRRATDRDLGAIFCSDMQRAVKTAMPSASALHIPIYVDARLRECDYGDFTSKPKDVVDAEKLSRITAPFPNGESYQQTIDRVGDFLTWLKQNFDGKTVMIIGHRATHYGLDHHVLGKPIAECISDGFVWQPGWEYELQ